MVKHAQLDPRDGILLVGHGTRHDAGVAEFLETARLIQQQTSAQVAPCFLELAEPTLHEGLRTLVGQGIKRLIVLPILLFSAGHAKRDIPDAVTAGLDELGVRLPVRMIGSLDCHPRLLGLSRLRFHETIASTGWTGEVMEDICLVMVGRGSRDPAANSEMARFARLRFEATPIGWLETAYLAMTQPDLPRTLDVVGRLPFSRVVVQPHLLFQGELNERIVNMTADAQRRTPDKAWFATDHLGPHELLAEALLDLVRLSDFYEPT